MADARIETIPEVLRGVRNDPEWLKKSGLGVLVMMAPYVGAVWLVGFALHYMRSLAWGGEDRLPEWRDAGAQIKTGFFAYIVAFVFSLPLSIFTGIAAVVAMQPLMSSPGAAPDAGFFVRMAVIFVALMPISLLLALALYPVYTHVALYDRIGAGFEFATIWNTVRTNSSLFWTAALRSLALSLLSTLAVFGIFAVVIGGAAWLLTSLLSLRLLVLLIYPLQFVCMLLGGLVSVPLSFATHRLWAGYARHAYRLESLPPAPQSAGLATPAG